eukprot:1156745-Pelagomonas_calceolata.AAC.9
MKPHLWPEFVCCFPENLTNGNPEKTNYYNGRMNQLSNLLTHCRALVSRHYPAKIGERWAIFWTPAPAPWTAQNMLLIECPAIAAGQTSQETAS